jgi:hypothetical protein
MSTTTTNHLICLERRRRFLAALLQDRPDDKSARHWTTESSALAWVLSLFDDTELDGEIRAARAAVDARPPAPPARRS